MTCSSGQGGFSVLHKISDTKRHLMRLLKDEGAATAIEYGLIIAIIGAALIVGLESVRDNLQAIFQTIVDALNNAMS